MQKIMFIDKYGLTQAVIEGRKTQTRRIAHAGYIKFPNTCIGLKGSDRNKLFLKNSNFIVAKSHYKIGEEVAVAQSYDMLALDVKYSSEELKQMILSEGWEDKMFVKAELMPHRIRITNIRAERLQYITDEECMAEGILRYEKEYCFTHDDGYGTDCYAFSTPREAYATLVDKISGKGTWASSPYVFVYEFELIK